MTVGFFLVQNGSVEALIGQMCAQALARSVRRVMPGVPVVQFTDETSDGVPDVDEVRRLPPEPLARLRMRHQASVTGEWLFVDSDVLVQRDVRPVFAEPFDIALTTRNWPHLRPSAGFTERMPFNTGVAFSRHAKFWRAAYDRVCNMPRDLQDWMGDQQAICDLVVTPKIKLRLLKGSRYNLPPALDGDAETNAELERKAHILHFKGVERKALLLDRIRREATCT